MAILGNHTTRHCGTATFTANLRAALTARFPRLERFVLAMNESMKNHAYPECVRVQIAQEDPVSYWKAAQTLNAHGAGLLREVHGVPTRKSSGRRGGWWDAGKTGLAAPPLETPRGWLMLYHGVRRTVSGCIYRVGIRRLLEWLDEHGEEPDHE
jgi:predicted GH43/DUF377 family glycosyl hydrolase